VDARLHRLQGEAEVVTDIAALLRDFHGEKLTMLLRHQAAARLVGQYDANNAYQYIINREDAQLSWVAQALAELGDAARDAPDVLRPAPGKGTDASHAVIAEDARDAQAFVDRWRPRIEGMTNARHAKMLQIILGETLEQKRLLDQALAGRLDLLGRRDEAAGARVGSVMAERWIE
jgi:hypothetical protein